MEASLFSVTTRSSNEPLGMGTLNATPSIFPLQLRDDQSDGLAARWWWG